MAAPPLSLQILRNPPSLATANVFSVDPSAASGANLSPAQIAQFVAAESVEFQFEIGDGVDALETLTGRTYRAAVGGLNQPATGGLFTWGDGVVFVPVQQPSNVTASDLQSALNALNGGTGPSGGTVEVLGPANGGAPFTVIWNAVGSRNLLTVDCTDGQPQCQSIIQRAQTGNGTTREIQLVQVIQVPLAYLSSLTVSGTTATGTLNFNTESVIQFLAANPSGQTVFEIEESDGTSVRKICQLPVVVNGYVAAPSSTITPIVPVGSFFVDTTVNANDTGPITINFGTTLAAIPRVIPTAFVNGVNAIATPVPGSVTTSGYQCQINGPWDTAGSIQTYVVPQ